MNSWHFLPISVHLLHPILKHHNIPLELPLQTLQPTLIQPLPFPTHRHNVHLVVFHKVECHVKGFIPHDIRKLIEFHIELEDVLVGFGEAALEKLGLFSKHLLDKAVCSGLPLVNELPDFRKNHLNATPFDLLLLTQKPQQRLFLFSFGGQPGYAVLHDSFNF
jgi:hypothetical protein